MNPITEKLEEVQKKWYAKTRGSRNLIFGQSKRVPPKWMIWNMHALPLCVEITSLKVQASE